MADKVRQGTIFSPYFLPSDGVCVCVHSNKQESSVKRNRRLASRLKGRSMLLSALHSSFAHPTAVPWQTWTFSIENLCLQRGLVGLVARIPPSVRELATEIFPFSFVAPVFTVVHTEISSLRASIVRICWSFFEKQGCKVYSIHPLITRHITCNRQLLENTG